MKDYHMEAVQYIYKILKEQAHTDSATLFMKIYNGDKWHPRQVKDQEGVSLIYQLRLHRSRL